MLILILVLLLFLIFVCVVASLLIHENYYAKAIKAKMDETCKAFENIWVQVYFRDKGLYRKYCIMNVTRIVFDGMNSDTDDLEAVELTPENGYGAYLPKTIKIYGGLKHGGINEAYCKASGSL